MRVIVVEENIADLMMLSKLAGHVDDCLVSPYGDGETALKEMKTHGCDLLMIDCAVPRFDGLDFVRRARADLASPDVPILMISDRSDPLIYKPALDAGVTDFLSRPVNPVEFRARVDNLLKLRRAAVRERERAQRLREAVADTTREVFERERELMLSLVRAIEFRDGEVGRHFEHVAAISRQMGEKLGLAEGSLDELFLAAPLHDIGKIGLPDEILRKPGALTLEERVLMQQHTLRGHAMLRDSRAPMLRTAALIALSHHERYDGAGYPNRLQGHAIPLEARIVAVADVFDALTSRRPYKPAWEVGRAREYLRNSAGSQFDPDCVAAFLAIDPPPGAGA